MSYVDIVGEQAIKLQAAAVEIAEGNLIRASAICGWAVQSIIMELYADNPDEARRCANSFASTLITLVDGALDQIAAGKSLQ